MNETYYIYTYVYNGRHDEESATRRIICSKQNAWIELTKKKYEHLEPWYQTTNPDDAVMEFEIIYSEQYHHYNKNYNDALYGVYGFNQQKLWDLYDLQWKKHQEAIDQLDSFNFIEKLQVSSYDVETFTRVNDKNQDNHKNKYIYFLKENDVIVYVGQTTATYVDKCNRPNSHTDKEYDSFDIIELDPSEDINLAEAFYIMKHKPKYNKAISVSKEMLMVLKFVFKTDWDPYKNRKLQS